MLPIRPHLPSTARRRAGFVTLTSLSMLAFTLWVMWRATSWQIILEPIIWLAFLGTLFAILTVDALFNKVLDSLQRLQND